MKISKATANGMAARKTGKALVPRPLDARHHKAQAPLTIEFATTQLRALHVDILIVAVEGTPALGRDAGHLTGALAQLDKLLHGQLAAELRRQRFKGAEGEVALFQTHGALPYPDIIIAGIGDGKGCRPWHRLAQIVVTRARDSHAGNIAVALSPTHLSPESNEPFTEGVLLSAYTFTALKGASKSVTARRRERRSFPERIVVLHPRGETALEAPLNRGKLLALATMYARDLIN